MNASQVLKGFDFGSRKAALSMLENQAIAARIDSFISEEQARKLTNKAGTYRFIQACAFIAQGVTDNLSSVHATLICTIATAKGAFTFADAHRVCGATLKDGTSAGNIKGVNKARLNKLLDVTPNLGTVSSRVSNSVGKNGFLTLMGACDKQGADTVKPATDAAQNAFVVAYIGALNALTEGQFKGFIEAQASKADNGE
jgi:hypothetical protein